MYAILTSKGAKRIRRPNMANQIVEISDLRTMPWGSRNATVLIDGEVVARGMQVYTPNHGKDYALMLIDKE